MKEARYIVEDQKTGQQSIMTMVEIAAAMSANQSENSSVFGVDLAIIGVESVTENLIC